jgi:hypothetical protein
LAEFSDAQPSTEVAFGVSENLERSARVGNGALTTNQGQKDGLRQLDAMTLLDTGSHGGRQSSVGFTSCHAGEIGREREVG